MTATHPSIQLCTSQVSLMISGFSNFSVITFLNFGCALLIDGFAVEYVWMLCRMSSEFLSSSSPGVIAVTCGTNLQPCWSTVAFTAFGAPLAPGTATPATSAIARNAPIALRIALAPPEFELCPSIRNPHHEQHHRQCEDCHDRRNDETAVRLRLLQPQIVP